MATKSTTAVRTVESESGTLREYFSHIFTVMALGLLLTGAVAMLLSSNPDLMKSLFNTVDVIKDGKTTTTFTASWWWYLAAFAQLGFVIVLSWFGLSNSLGWHSGLVMFGLYAALTGFTLSPVIYAYTTGSVAQAFFITAAMFGACALWGHTTKRDLTPFGGFLLAALVGLLLMMVANIYFRSPLADYAVSGIAVLLFAVLTAYDMQMLEKMYKEEGNTYTGGLVVAGALVLYLDFLNMFLHLLRFVGISVPGRND